MMICNLKVIISQKFLNIQTMYWFLDTYGKLYIWIPVIMQWSANYNPQSKGLRPLI